MFLNDYLMSSFYLLVCREAYVGTFSYASLIEIMRKCPKNVSEAYQSGLRSASLKIIVSGFPGGLCLGLGGGLSLCAFLAGVRRCLRFLMN